MPVPSGGVPPYSPDDLGDWVRIAQPSVTSASTWMLRATWWGYWRGQGWTVVESR
ncbi:hypothetical protein [Frankia sp. AvcI1]|uniref:hypothetical protein n=1 Tax=Frankia sp. AvcI1 TaxID=573496 RepID=UPI0021199B80|nr:hypothetical protein [Frankia sp. AvcI1]